MSLNKINDFEAIMWNFQNKIRNFGKHRTSCFLFRILYDWIIHTGYGSWKTIVL